MFQRYGPNQGCQRSQGLCFLIISHKTIFPSNCFSKNEPVRFPDTFTDGKLNEKGLKINFVTNPWENIESDKLQQLLLAQLNDPNNSLGSALAQALNVDPDEVKVKLNYPQEPFVVLTFTRATTNTPAPKQPGLEFSNQTMLKLLFTPEDLVWMKQLTPEAFDQNGNLKETVALQIDFEDSGEPPTPPRPSEEEKIKLLVKKVQDEVDKDPAMKGVALTRAKLVKPPGSDEQLQLFGKVMTPAQGQQLQKMVEKNASPPMPIGEKTTCPWWWILPPCGPVLPIPNLRFGIMRKAWICSGTKTMKKPKPTS